MVPEKDKKQKNKEQPAKSPRHGRDADAGVSTAGGGAWAAVLLVV